MSSTPTTDPSIEPPKPHPAKYSTEILGVFEDVLEEHLPLDSRILDPFGGVGGIHAFNELYHTYAVEIEPEWAMQSAQFGPTWCGDFFDFNPALWNGIYRVGDVKWPAEHRVVWPTRFNAIVTSPTYANRMADNHNARDDSKRITYKHKLGRDLTENNSGGMQWGDEYRAFHTAAWRKCYRDLLDKGGLAVINVKNHVRNKKIMPVVEWHRDRLARLGFHMLDDIEVETRGMRFGQNHALRVESEHVLVYVK